MIQEFPILVKRVVVDNTVDSGVALIYEAAILTKITSIFQHFMQSSTECEIFHRRVGDTNNDNALLYDTQIGEMSGPIEIKTNIGMQVGESIYAKASDGPIVVSLYGYPISPNRKETTQIGI